jgi:very-short-patch-repair endonuclease
MDGRDTHRHADATLAVIAARQHGVFSRFQALDAGLTRGMIDRRVSSGRWLIDDFRVYRIAGAPKCWKQRLMAPCLAGPAVASHRAAGILWNFPEMPHEIVEVTALRHHRRHAADITWHESNHLTDRDVTKVDGIPVTRPIRTFLDLGVCLPHDRLEVVLEDGLHRKLLDLPAVWRRLEELGELRPGAKRVRALLEQRVCSRPAESVLETRFRQLVRGAGLPMPLAQYEIRLNGSIARVDFAYTDLKVAIELDGAAYHTGEKAKKRDRRRERLLGASGWRVLRFDWDEVTNAAEYVIQTLDAYLDQRMAGRGTHH